MAVEGFVEGVVGDRLIGWAYDPAQPDGRVTLNIEFDGEYLGECVADLERSDLLSAGIGDGRHAFRFPLERPLAAGSSHTVTARAPDGTIVPVHRDYVADAHGETDGPPPVLTTAAEAVKAEPEHSDPDPFVGEATTLVGERGWLFDLTDPSLLRATLGEAPPSPWALGQLCDTLVASAAAIAGHGGTYVPAILPDKAVVYAERLPAGVHVRPADRPAEALAARIRDVDEVDMLDLLPVIRHARRHGRTHPRRGSALTWEAAAQVSRALIKEARKHRGSLVPIPADAFPAGDLLPVDADLAGRPLFVLQGDELLRLDPRALGVTEPEQEPDLDWSGMRSTYAPLPPELSTPAGDGATLLVNESSDAGTAMLVHDGNGRRLAPFLAEAFSRTLVVIADAPPVGAVTQFEPAFVFHVIGERSLLSPSATG